MLHYKIVSNVVSNIDRRAYYITRTRTHTYTHWHASATRISQHTCVRSKKRRFDLLFGEQIQIINIHKSTQLWHTALLAGRGVAMLISRSRACTPPARRINARALEVQRRRKITRRIAVAHPGASRWNHEIARRNHDT